MLHQVDPGIVSAYLTQSCAKSFALPIKEKNEHAIRLLEAAEVQCGEDGEFYARQLKELFIVIDQEASPERQPILDNVVEKVLLYVKEGEDFLYTVGDIC